MSLAEGGRTLLERVLVEAFPFHLIVDREGRVVRRGDSLALACPALEHGAPVGPLLRFAAPRTASWESATSAPPPRGLVLLRGVSSGLVLRGQLLAGEDGVLFLGSPWVTSIEEVTRLGLRLTDFSPADPVTDLLMLLGAQGSALHDAGRLAEQLEAAAARQLHQATHDSLTGLPNRDHFELLLTEGLGEIAGTPGSLGVVLLDLDRFKEINDTLGHHCGDRLLQQIGPRITAVLRRGETVARLGGDEFALLARSARPGHQALGDVERLARRVIEELSRPFVVDGLTLAVEASAGVALAPEHGTTSEELLQHADVAMYVAKAGHEMVVPYHPDLDGHNPRRLRLLAQLRVAADRGDLVLHYQPLLHLASRRVLGVEALVRWQHPDEGLLPPSDFVPLAESSGFIHRLTREVLAMACRQATRWQQAGCPLVVSVNISARSLLDLTLADTVAGELAAAELDPVWLKLEITESAIIGDPTRAGVVIAALRELGVALSIDDFGTGYTSLRHLRDLPVQELKLDRSFVTTMLAEPKNAAIVRTAVELAGRLGLVSVAEGVEDEATLQALAELGCHTAQGYHLARPMPAAQVPGWLESSYPSSAGPVRKPVLRA